jgi:TonB family protein
MRVTKVDPEYPPLALQARVQGMVRLQVRITKKGDVYHVQLVSGHPVLAPATIEAVKQWKYKPYLLNGEPMQVETIVQLAFKLPNELEAKGIVTDFPLELAPLVNGAQNIRRTNPDTTSAVGDAPRVLLGNVPSGVQDSTYLLGPVYKAVRVSEEIMRAMRILKVDPLYPPLPKGSRIQGQVILSIRINQSGEVVSIRTISGDPLLGQAAINGVKQWKYQPYLLNGEPIGVKTQVHLSFTLPEEQSGKGFVTDSPLEPKSETIGVVGDVPGGIPSTDSNTATASPVPALGTPQRVRVSSGVAQGLLVTKVNPDYPPDARDQHIQGVVLLKVIIGREGNIDSTELISGHPLLAPAALDAVKRWKYKPFLLNGTPVEVESQIQVNFTLVK